MHYRAHTADTVVWGAVRGEPALIRDLYTFYNFPLWIQAVKSINKDFTQVAWSVWRCLSTQMAEWVQQLTHVEGLLSHSSGSFFTFSAGKAGHHILPYCTLHSSPSTLNTGLAIYATESGLVQVRAMVPASDALAMPPDSCTPPSCAEHL